MILYEPPKQEAFGVGDYIEGLGTVLDPDDEEMGAFIESAIMSIRQDIIEAMGKRRAEIAASMGELPDYIDCNREPRAHLNACGTGELKPCPFCGSGTLYEGYHKLDGFDTPVMFCNCCKALVTFEGFEDYVTNENDGMTELRAAWNRRA